MTTPALTATPIAVTPATAQHPLATHTGISVLVELLTADQAWRACTKPQRRLLAEACLPAVTVLADGVSLPAEALPWLPDTVRPAMRDALVRRGMAYESGQISAKAVHACYWVWWRDALASAPTANHHTTKDTDNA